MIALDNGIYREMTEEEVSETVNTAPLAPSSEDRIQALESAMLDMILGG